MKKFLKDLWAAMVAEDQQPPMNPWMLALGQAANIIVIILVSLIICLFTGCKSTHEVQTVFIHTTDTLTQTVNTRDSIHVHDSIHVKEWQKGDTIYIDRYKQRIEYIDRLQHDSIYIARTDTVYRDREKVIEKRLTWWQQIKQTIGGIAVFALILSLLYYATRRIKLR